MQYTKDVPRDDPDALQASREHVIAYLSAAVDEDDDPETNADDVRVEVFGHPSDPDLFRIVGTIDGQPQATYLRPGFDAFADVPRDLMADAGLTSG